MCCQEETSAYFESKIRSFCARIQHIEMRNIRPRMFYKTYASFSEQGHLCGRAEADGLRTQIQRLLDSRSSVVEQRKQYVIALPF